MYKVVLLISGVVLQISNVSSQNMSLDSVFFYIKKNNPDLQMVDAEIKAMDTYSKGAKAWEAPLLSAGFYMTPYNVSLWKADPGVMGSQGMGSIMFSAQQMIPNPRKLKAGLSLMQSMSSTEKENRKVMSNQLLAQAKSAYYDWIILEKKIHVVYSTEELMQLMIKTAESRYAYNKEKLNTIYKTKASLFELNTMEIMLSSEIEQKRITLNTLMNRDKNTLFKIDTNYQLKSFEVAALDTGKLASHLSEVKSIDQSIQLAKLRQNVENSKRLPDFGIKYDHMNTFGTQANLYSLMGMITVPIAPWSSKMYSSNAAALNHEINSLQRKKESVLNETSGMLQGLRSELAGKKQQVLLYETKIIPAFQNNYQTSILSYQQNTEELFMVLDALQTLKMAQITYLDKVGELLKLQVEFEKLLEEIE